MENIWTYTKTFEEFHSLQEKEGKEKEGKEAPAPSGDSDSAFAGKTPMAKKMVIDGVTFTAVPSTFNAIASKQNDMGEEAVGVITLPGSKAIYELLKMEEKKEKK